QQRSDLEVVGQEPAVGTCDRKGALSISIVDFGPAQRGSEVDFVQARTDLRVRVRRDRGGHAHEQYGNPTPHHLVSLRVKRERRVFRTRAWGAGTPGAAAVRGAPGARGLAGDVRV